MSGRGYDPTDPLYYDDFFGFSAELSECESNLADETFGEIIAIQGFPIDVYICTHFNPMNVFGEDPLKKYLADSFVAKAIWDVTPEVQTFGAHEKLAETEKIVLYMHKTTIKESIRTVLIDAGLLDDDTITDEEVMTKFARNRLDLQEQDMIRLYFNNIHYEIDGIKLEPEYQPMLRKYVYEVHATPRLVSAEELGDMQPVTDADAIRVQHDYEIDSEADVILF